MPRKYNGVSRVCPTCGNTFYCWPSPARPTAFTYCSWNCRPRRSDEQALAVIHSRLDKSGECWEWTGARKTLGYGKMSHQGHLWGVHRLIWTLTHGPIPDGLSVLHRCDNPPCCRPEHLFLGTQSDNARDMVAKGRSNTGPKHPLMRLTPEQVREIRARYIPGQVRAKDLAGEYGVSPSHIWAIAVGKNRKSD